MITLPEESRIACTREWALGSWDADFVRACNSMFIVGVYVDPNSRSKMSLTMSEGKDGGC